MNPQIYGQLSSDKGAETIPMGTGQSSQQMVLEQVHVRTQENEAGPPPQAIFKN